MYGIQIGKAYQPDWYNTNIYKTQLQPLYEERLKIIKKLCNKHVTLNNKNLYIYRACWHKTTFNQIFLNTDDPVQRV